MDAIVFALPRWLSLLYFRFFTLFASRQTAAKLLNSQPVTASSPSAKKRTSAIHHGFDLTNVIAP
jgi:hypothetical protein